MSEKWKWAGARWWKFDFHTHTPKSNDYGNGPNQEELKRRTPREWLLDYMNAGIDCVAITDHNSGGWIDKLKDEIEKMKSEKHPDYHPLYLFPGVEISVNSGIHILAIFSLEKTKTDIDRLLGSVDYHGEEGKSDDCTKNSPVEVIQAIHDAYGIAIPAHVDEKNGLFNLRGTSLNQVLGENNIKAMEVCNKSKKKPALYHDKKLQWAEIIGSDQHHPTGKAGDRYPGSHYTWIKMSEPTLDGLHLALLDGEMSVKRYDEVKGDPNKHGSLIIESISVTDAKYMGRDNPLASNMNPWLNTIIGGRGTGKSTLVEFARQVFRRENELPDSLRIDHEKYTKVPQNRNDEGLLTKDTLISAIYRKDGKRFRIQWNVEGNVPSIQEDDGSGNWKKTEGDIQIRFPVRIYSQKQIFESAKRPQALLQVIDDSLDVEQRKWFKEMENLEKRYLSLKAQSRDIEVKLDEVPRIQGELDDIKNKMEVFEKAGHAEVLKEFQFRQRQKHIIDDWENSWKDTYIELKTFSESIIPTDMDKKLFDEKKKEDLELILKINDKNKLLDNARNELLAIANIIKDEFDEWSKTRFILKISKQINDAEKKYEELKIKLNEIGSENPSEYGLLVQRRRNLEEQLKNYESRKMKLDDLKKQSETTLGQIKKHRNTLILIRSEFLERTLTDNHHVEISVIPFGNKLNVEEMFRKLINREQGGFERDIGSPDSSEGLLSELYIVNSDIIQDRIENLKEKMVRIRNGEINDLKDIRFGRHIESLPPENIDRLMCWFPDDSLDVKYRSAPGKNLRPINEGSPGQKTAALLAFILSYGEEPLILDQPEDDLDNHLIYDLVVRQLKEMKQKRQVIVVTHNANIVVNGDSENVISLDPAKGQSRISTQGSLQKSVVRKDICNVMEGGTEAFDLRYRRIKAGDTNV